MSRYQHGYLWHSLATPPHRPLLPAGPQGNILYRHIAAVCRFELVVLPLLSHVKGSAEVHHLWACPYFSSSVLNVWLVYFFFFLENHGKQHGGSELAIWRLNAMPNPVPGVWTLRFNGQDRLVQSEELLLLIYKGGFRRREQNSHRKIIMTRNSEYINGSVRDLTSNELERHVCMQNRCEM